ncbi:MAG: hypothetical protein EPO22_00665 [Dehalococcoidia bacterium]|nr:MAG: hypothetical protein EPO22_00665 [Dehalococcoidia bacterium]
MKHIECSTMVVLAALSFAAAACGQPLTTAEETQTAQAAVSAVATRDAMAASPASTATEPPVVVRTPIPGAAKDGLFADGVANLPFLDTTDWRTYTSNEYGLAFQYPPNWQLTESDSSGHHGPNGEPAYPLFRVEVSNPPAEQGEKIPGENCSGAANDCSGPPPGLLSFSAAIWGNGSCNIAGDLIVSDSATITGHPGTRCVVEYPNDKSRTTAIAVALADGTYLVVQFERGNSVASAAQAVLDAVVSTLVISTTQPTTGATP